jgi:hypothetical protein
MRLAGAEIALKDINGILHLSNPTNMDAYRATAVNSARMTTSTDMYLT